MTTASGALRPLGLLVSVLACACATARDATAVATIYRTRAPQAAARAPSIIFVPGIQGSVLVDPADGRRYWGRTR